MHFAKILTACVATAFLFNLSAVAQDERSVAAANLVAAKELSAASGRPIFAIAGRKT